MYAKCNTKNGVLQVSLRNIADEFNIKRHQVDYILHKFYSCGLLVNTKSTVSQQLVNNTTTDYQQVRTYQSTVSQQLVNTNSTLDIRKHTFGERLIPYIPMYGKQMIRQFFDYWTETSLNGKKMRFEKEKTFEVPKRLARWNMNNGNYNNKNMNYEQRQQDERQQRLSEYASVAAAFARQAEEDLRSRASENQEGAS